jgi:hypothetical protein
VVVQTRDKGVTWSAYGTLPKANELLCFLKSKDGSVYAGTTPNGDVFKLASATGVAEPPGPPRTLLLSQNYPNPFSARGGSAYGGNPDTYIHYRLGGAARVNLSVFDIRGERVRVLVDGERRASDAIVIWDGFDERKRALHSGVYVYRLKIREPDGTVRQAQKKMLMVK